MKQENVLFQRIIVAWHGHTIHHSADNVKPDE